MDTEDPNSEDPAGPADFERELEAFLLEAFARGETVEGTWRLGAAVEAVPEWSVEITKTADANPSHDPELIK